MMRAHVPALLLLLLAGTAAAEIDVRHADADMYPDDISYDPAVPRPAAILGHELGAEPVRHHKLVEYILEVAESSPRLSVEVIGYSHERRPILFVVATSADNHGRLDEIRARHVALSEPSTNSTIDDDMPVVTWLNYGVHGAESSGMDAVLPFIYYLAAVKDERLEQILQDSVVLITAIFNPDGHAARVAWLDSWGGDNDIADPAHIEHGFSWTFARTNHYGFDLNRQWLLLTQPEPQAWMRKWHEWRPNLTVDYHEMGSHQTYYFHPGVATRTNPLVPEEAERLMARTVATSEAFLDREGRLYFHGESFDNFYIGKGSTFPLVNGGVGVLYEAAAALGREIETANGLRTYRENIRKHFRTSIASIDAAAAMRSDYLDYQRRFYADAMRDAAAHSIGGWVVGAPGDPVRLEFFAELLKTHRIRAYRPASSIEVDGRRFEPANSLVVPAAQPQFRLLRGIFDKVTEFEDSTFYDVSAWTLPPAFGLEHAELRGRAFRPALLGDEFEAAREPVAPPESSNYGYVFTWDGYYAPRALQRIVGEDILARVATKPFSVTTAGGDRSFSRGSIVVPLDRQTVPRERIYKTMQEIAEQDRVVVHSLRSGRSANGTQGVEPGGPSFRAVTEPRVLMLIDDSNIYDYGEVWHLLDYRMDMPVSIRKRSGLAEIDWARYTHLVFPGGEFDDSEPEFLPRLRQWINEGGTVVATRTAAPWIRKHTLDWVDPESPEAAGAGSAEESSTDDEAPPERADYADKQAIEALDLVSGAIFTADIDTSHPLAFGYRNREIYLHKNVKEPLQPVANRWATVIAYDSKEPVAAGYASADNAAALAGTPALIAERFGKGSIILFADNPNFRGYWYGTNKLFMNSLFFSTAFDAPSED